MVQLLDILTTALLAQTTNVETLSLAAANLEEWGALHALNKLEAPHKEAPGEEVQHQGEQHTRLIWPNLHQVVVWGWNGRNPGRHRPTISLASVAPILGAAPNLRTLRMNCFKSMGPKLTKETMPTLPNLTQLWLDDCDNYQISALDALLSACPNLASLDMRCGIVDDDAMPRKIAALLPDRVPHLESLTVDFRRAESQRRAGHGEKDRMEDRIVSLQELQNLKGLSLSVLSTLQYEEIRVFWTSQELDDYYHNRDPEPAELLTDLLPESIEYVCLLSDQNLFAYLGAKLDLDRLREAVSDGRFTQLKTVVSRATNLWDIGIVRDKETIEGLGQLVTKFRREFEELGVDFIQEVKGFPYPEYFS